MAAQWGGKHTEGGGGRSTEPSRPRWVFFHGFLHQKYSRNKRAQSFVLHRWGRTVQGSLPLGVLPITFRQRSGDSEPRRLVGLANIIGNLTNILPALRLCHIIQGQHLRIRAINSRVLEQTNNRGVTSTASKLAAPAASAPAPPARRGGGCPRPAPPRAAGLGGTVGAAAGEGPQRCSLLHRLQGHGKGQPCALGSGVRMGRGEPPGVLSSWCTEGAAPAWIEQGAAIRPRAGC